MRRVNRWFHGASSTRLCRLCAAVATLGCVAFWGGCTASNQAYQQKDTAVVEEGDKVHQKLEVAVVEAPEVERYLQQVGRRIIDAARDLEAEGLDRDKNHNPSTTAWMFADDVKFHLVNNPRVNAVATGGNHMYVYNGFLQECQSEEELAAVLAHEFGHVYARHVQRGQVRQGFWSNVQQGLMEAAKGDDGYMSPEEEQKARLYAGAAGAVGGATVVHHTRDEEVQADKLGFAFYVRAGYDPEKFPDLFQAQLDKGARNAQGFAEFLSDHPGLASRVQLARSEAAKLPPEAASWRKPSVATPVRLRKVKDTAAAAVAGMPESPELAEAQGLLGAFPSCFSDEDDHD